MSLNHITAMGRLTAAPELRTTNSGKSVVSFTIAVDRDYQKGETDFISCIAWGNTAEFVTKYFFRGKTAVVSGSMQSRKWEDRNGNSRISWEINVQDIYFGDDRRREDGGARQGGYGPQSGYGQQDGYGQQGYNQQPQQNRLPATAQNYGAQD